ncbi:MAG: hypothetical protein OHK0039_37330 [Bacteroidia bacterium]
MSLDSIFDRSLELGQIDPKRRQDLDCQTFALADQSQQQMFRANVVMAQADSLFPAIGYDILHAIRKILFHTFTPRVYGAQAGMDKGFQVAYVRRRKKGGF